MSSRDLSFSEAVRTLARFQKSSKGAPAYSRFVNRPLGRLFAAAAYRLGMTPNQVTLVSGLTSLAGILVLAFVPISGPTGVLVAVLLMAGYAMDSADGQLARLTGGGSAAGEWLDHVVDCVKINLVHLTVLVSLYRFSDLGREWLLIPVAYVVVANLYFFAYILGDLLKRSRGVKPAKSVGTASVLRSLVVVPTDYGLLAVTFFAWGATPVFLALYTLLLLGTAGYVALGLPKWFGDMVALDRPSVPTDSMESTESTGSPESAVGGVV